jgi:hypothetical protein
MDFIYDFFISLDFVKQHQERPEPQFVLAMKFKSRPDVAGEAFVYGDDDGPKHLQIVVKGLSDERDASDFIDPRWRDFINSLEVSASLISGQNFKVTPIEGTGMVVMVSHEFDGNNHWPPARIELSYASAAPFPYEELRKVMGSHFPELIPYLFYLRRAINPTLDKDYRWLNAYKICELRYNPDGTGLSKNKEWKTFVKRFYNKLKPYGRSSGAEGIVEQLRTLAAHAVSRGGINGYGTSLGKTESKRIEDSLAVIMEIAATIINELPGNQGLKLGTFPVE